MGGRLVTPTPLDNGYWLDNRGISSDVAFLSYTYEEYSALPQAPSMQEMLDRIVDKDPLTVIVDCGRRADYDGDLREAMNRYIRDHGLQ